MVIVVKNSIDPVVFFKLCLVGYLENIISDRKLITHCSMRLDILFFIGYDIDEDLPRHSTISRTRQLLPESVFEEVFTKVLSLCVEKGMVSGHTQAIDSAPVKAICEYALINEVPLYNALTDTQSECLQLFRLLDTYLKQRTATKNKIHGEAVLGIPSKFVYRSLIRNKKQLNKEVAAIELKILSLVKEDQQEQLTLLTSIPGIGQKTALFLIVVTDGFSKFENATQLCSYVGITPTIRESGSSVTGRARISKVGNRKLRNLLFLCSFNTCKHNKACKEVYERIVNKGAA